MIERRPWLTALSHAVLLIGVLIVAFPVYITFVASTHTAQEIVQSPMPLLPGDRFWHNYQAVLTGSERGPGAGAPVAKMMWVSLVSALVIIDRQDRDLAAVSLCDRLLPLPVPDVLLLGHLRHADAAGGGAHLSDLQGRGRPAPAQQLRRADDPADRLGHGHLPVPAVLHDRAGRAGRGRTGRRRRADALLQGRAAAAVDHQRSRRCS
jgi:hypothetical protein